MDITEAAKAFRVPITDRKKYVEKNIGFVVTPETLAAIRKNGIPFTKWADFRKTYNWAPTFASNIQPSKDKVGITFYSGEGDDYNYPLDKTFTATGHRLPSQVDFNYTIATQTGNNYYIVHFDEAEIVDAFTRLSAKQLPLQLEFDPKFPKEQTQVRLHNGKEAIVLKKFTVKSK